MDPFQNKRKSSARLTKLSYSITVLRKVDVMWSKTEPGVLLKWKRKGAAKEGC